MKKNLPNLLTLSRIILIPVLMAAFYTDNRVGRWIAAIAFICACLTDFLDGYVARLWKNTTRLGIFLDPIADKLLVATTLLLLVGFRRIGPVSYFPAVIILCREILVSGLREFLSSLQVSLPVSYLAKWKTGVQMSALGLLLLGDDFLFGSAVQEMGIFLLWLAGFLTIITGYDYLRAGLKHF